MQLEQAAPAFKAHDPIAPDSIITGPVRSRSASAMRRPLRRAASEDVEALLARLDPEVRASFTEAQKRALGAHLFTRGRARHTVDLRHTLSFFGRRFYLAFFFGREKRRVASEPDTCLKGWIGRYLASLGLALLLLAPLLALAHLVRG